MTPVAEKTTDEKDELFTKLKSDIELRKNCADLIEICENPSDGRALELILKQEGFTGIQRKWMNKLLGREGAKFVFDMKSSKVKK